MVVSAVAPLTTEGVLETRMPDRTFSVNECYWSQYGENTVVDTRLHVNLVIACAVVADEFDGTG